MAFSVDAPYVRDQVLGPLIGRGARYENVVDPSFLEGFIEHAKAEVQQRLSTRFEPTEFVGWDGIGERPEDTVAEGEALASEIEPPYDWPSITPGAGYITIRLRQRPILKLNGAHLRLPGAVAPGVDFKPEWFRVNSREGEIVLMPNFGAGAMYVPNMPFGFFPWMYAKIPDGVLVSYRAGMTETEWRRFPQINRLVALLAGITALPTLALHINPTQVTSKSADGLSLSRSSGYVFKDLEERLQKEAGAIQSQILDAWEGSSALGVL